MKVWFIYIHKRRLGCISARVCFNRQQATKGGKDQLFAASLTPTGNQLCLSAATVFRSIRPIIFCTIQWITTEPDVVFRLILLLFLPLLFSKHPRRALKSVWSPLLTLIKSTKLMGRKIHWLLGTIMIPHREKTSLQSSGRDTDVLMWIQ